MGVGSSRDGDGKRTVVIRKQQWTSVGMEVAATSGGGVRVAGLEPSGPAAAAGLSRNDQILSINARRPESEAAARGMILAAKSDLKITFKPGLGGSTSGASKTKASPKKASGGSAYVPSGVTIRTGSPHDSSLNRGHNRSGQSYNKSSVGEAGASRMDKKELKALNADPEKYLMQGRADKYFNTKEAQRAYR
eukprot:2802334-Prymnesium_polylepis.1